MERLIQIQREILTAFAAKVMVVAVETADEDGLLRAVKTVAGDRKAEVAEWSCASGWKDGGAIEGGALSLEEALAQVGDTAKRAIVVMWDPFPWLQDPMSPQGAASAGPVRKVKELIGLLKGQPKETSRLLLLVGRSLTLPPDLSGEVPVLRLGMPDTEELKTLLETAAAEAGLKLETSTATAEAGTGLSTSSFMQAVKRSLVSKGTVDAAAIHTAKKESLKGSALEWIEPTGGLESIGGLEVLKEWLCQRRMAFDEKARAFGLPIPRGVLCCGVPGTGKSLAAKATAIAWGMPLLRLDTGSLFGKFVGDSEASIRQALKIAETVAPCILYIDELEKSLSGMDGGASDGGTASRVFSTLLTWMQEKTAPVFLFATANRVELLPPELLRKGRFDELFFIDLPHVSERKAIWTLHIASRGRDPGTFNLDELSRKSDGLSGAEIEAAFVDAMWRAFCDGVEVQTEHALASLRNTVPLSKSMPEKIAQIRTWAKGRARSASEELVANADAGLASLESLDSDNTNNSN